MITGAESLLYPSYASAPPLFGLAPFADQRLGGVIMWVPAGLVPLLAFTAIFFRWAASEVDDPPGPPGPEEDPGRAARAAAPGRPRNGALL
jgi:cytochrome c oxidase assembly factor CtaG